MAKRWRFHRGVPCTRTGRWGRSPMPGGSPIRPLPRCAAASTASRCRSRSTPAERRRCVYLPAITSRRFTMLDPGAIQELRVYPPIGIARVGNAAGPDDYVIGPELIGGAATLPGVAPELPARYVGDFRNGIGEIKRQAARFRIYAHMKNGSVEEVTAASAKIEWRVAVANLKAGWYDFNQAMDLGAISQDALQRNRDLVDP